MQTPFIWLNIRLDLAFFFISESPNGDEIGKRPREKENISAVGVLASGKLTVVSPALGHNQNKFAHREKSLHDTNHFDEFSRDSI